VAAIEVQAPAREVAADGLGRAAPDRDDALLAALARAAHEPGVEVDTRPVEADGLADAEPRAVEELDERLIAERARRRARGGVDQPLRLCGRERAGEPAVSSRQLELGRGVVQAHSEERLVAEEGPKRRRAARDCRARPSGGALLGEVARNVVARRGADRAREPAAEGREVASVGVDCPRRTARREQREEAVDFAICRLGHGAGEFAPRRESPAARRYRHDLGTVSRGFPE